MEGNRFLRGNGDLCVTVRQKMKDEPYAKKRPSLGGQGFSFDGKPHQGQVRAQELPVHKPPPGCFGIRRQDAVWQPTAVSCQRCSIRARRGCARRQFLAVSITASRKSPRLRKVPFGIRGWTLLGRFRTGRRNSADASREIRRVHRIRGPVLQRETSPLTPTAHPAFDSAQLDLLIRPG